MKNNPYKRPGYAHAVGDATRDYYSVWGNDHKKKVKEPQKPKKEKTEKKLKANKAALPVDKKVNTAEKKSNPVATLLLAVLLIACIASVVVLNFFIPQEMKEQILQAFKDFIGMQF